MKEFIKTKIFPGINLHARDRFRHLPKKFGEEIGKGKKVLDAGCGNGMLSFQAWRRGGEVMGICIKQNEIDGCQLMFNQGKGISEEGLKFRNLNLYDMGAEEHQFDAIICTEVLEHIKDDAGICRKFYELLKPGGVIHVTYPNGAHPYNETFPLDLEEKGGHVRPGYTEESSRALFEPLGFSVEEVSGFGGPIRQFFNWRIKAIQERLGAWAGVPLFLLSYPWILLDSASPKVPFSLYVKVRKPV